MASSALRELESLRRLLEPPASAAPETPQSGRSGTPQKGRANLPELHHAEVRVAMTAATTGLASLHLHS